MFGKYYRPLSSLERGELTKDLLRLIQKVLDESEDAKEVNAHELINYYQPQDRLERNRVWKAIKYLEEQERIQLTRKNNSHFLYITEEGEMKLEEDEVWELRVKKPRQWDKRWRLVMFDVPTSLSKNRVLFRQRLETLGFKQYQMSVFVYPYDCKGEVLHIAEWCGIRTFVRYVVVADLDDEQRFIDMFNL